MHILSFVITALVAASVGAAAASFSGVSVMQHPTMEQSMQGMVHSMDVGHGEDADNVFLDGMIVHHEGAVEMAKRVLQTTQRAEVRKLAEDIIAAQTQEIGMMRGWEKEWFGK